MEQRHKYEYAVNLQEETAATKVVRMVGRERKVLEIGAGPGSITRLLKEHGSCRVTAIERDATALPKLAAYCEQVHQADLNDPDWVTRTGVEKAFQVVVAADVLEHLYDPWAALTAMKQCLRDDGCIVVSLPHAGHAAVIGCLAAGNFEYRDWGLLDRTHIRFFGIANMQELIEGAGLKVVEAEFVVRSPEQTELADHWRRLPAQVRHALGSRPHGTVYQVVLKAVPTSAPGLARRLDAIPVPTPGSRLPPGTPWRTRAIAWLKDIVRPHLSQDAQHRIVGILRRLGLRR